MCIRDRASSALDAVVSNLSNNETINAALKQLTEGSQSLTDGLGELVKNNDTLNAGASQLNAGLAQLSGNNDALNGGIAQISAGLAQLSDNNDTLNGGIAQISAGLAQLNDNNDALNGEMCIRDRAIIRISTPDDDEREAKNREKEKEAYKICLEKIKKHNLEMKLIKVEYTFDNNKVLFYFTADGRIDFRELVKDLAAVFKTRIELRQIGVRDETKILGGIGSCGRPVSYTHLDVYKRQILMNG